MEERRTALAVAPDTTSDEAEAIFAVIKNLIGDGAMDAGKKLGISLAIVAAFLPHGQRGATIQKLIALAPRRSRAALLLSLVLSGHTIDVGLVKDGLAEVMEAGKKQSWILSDNYEVREWLRLLPFTDQPADALAVVQGLAAEQVGTDRLEEMIGAFSYAPGDDAEKALQALADAYPSLRENYAWRNAVFRRDTGSSARWLVDMAASGKLDGRNRERWHTARQIGFLLEKNPDLRQHVYGLLTNGTNTPGLALLAEAVAESPDADGLLLLLLLDGGGANSRISWRTIEGVATKRVPDESWNGAYNVVPVLVAEMRQKLLALTTNGGPADGAARCLNDIDRLRDDYGTPETELRHPDLPSGKPWPIMTPDPFATAAE